MNSHNHSKKDKNIIRRRLSKKKQKPYVEVVENKTEDLFNGKTGIITEPTPTKPEKNIFPNSSNRSAKGYSSMNKNQPSSKKYNSERNPHKRIRKDFTFIESNVHISKIESKLKDEKGRRNVEIFKLSANEITNFSKRKLGQKFYSLLRCRSCKLFFDAKREPRFYLHNENSCTDCIRKMSNLSETYVKMQFPLNYSYRSAVPLLFKLAGISCPKTIFVDELARAINNKCKQQFAARNIFTVMQQNMHHISDVIDCLDNEVTDEQSDHNLTVLETMESLERCKTFIERPHNCNKLANSFYKTFIRLGRYNTFCGAPDQKIKDIDDVSLYKQTLRAYPCGKSTEFSLTLLEHILYDGLELFAYIDVDHWRLYSKVKVSNHMFYMASFHPKFPSMSSYRIGNFTRFDESSVKTSANGYFEIPVAVTNEKNAPISNPRFFILFGPVDFSCHVASLFLGNNGYSILGTEILVTEESVIFKYFPRIGSIPEEFLVRNMERNKSTAVREGMVVVEVEGESCRLIVYRCSMPAKFIKFVVGIMHKFSLLQLRKFPLGMYKITNCGINILTDDSRPLLPT